MLSFSKTTDLTSDIYIDSLAIRKEVFIQEQNVSPEIEIDAKEKDCIHIVGYNDMNEPVATARLYPLTSNSYKVQRVAVLKPHRGKGYGKFLLEEIAAYAKENGATALFLGAQNQAIPFYKRLGYQIIGEEYEEAGILHHDMKKRYKKS